MATKLVYVFERFSLDLGRGSLSAQEREIALRPKSFELLRYLVENADRLASKEELMQALWPDVTVTDDSLKRCISDVRAALGDDAQRIIKTVPRRGVRFAAPVRVLAEERDDASLAGRITTGQPPALPERPSIAVMPFGNMSGDPAQDYFADGIVEDIITALSRTRWLFVIARNSTFTYKGRAVELRQVGRELGVRYLLEGSVRRSGDRVRITAQLLEAETGVHLWADRFDGRLEDIFDLQDDIASSIVGCIEPKMRTAEVRRAATKPTTSLQAYDHFLRAFAAFTAFSPDNLEATLVECRRALALDPGYASAYGLAAWCGTWRHHQMWATDLDEERAQAVQHAWRAVEFGADDPTALWMAGHTIAHLTVGTEDGARIIDRALAINPNSAEAWSVSGYARTYLGQGKTAIDHFRKALRLSPLDPLAHSFRSGIAMAYLTDRQYQEALEWADLALTEQPKFVSSLRIRVGALGLLGRTEDAKDAARALLAVVPNLTIAGITKDSWRATHHHRPFIDALRAAGIPET